MPVLRGLCNPDSRHALRYAMPWKTTCSVSGTGRKLVMNSSALSQVQSVSIPAAHRAQDSATGRRRVALHTLIAVLATCQCEGSMIHETLKTVLRPIKPS